jgi:hypothetical protein
MSDSSLEERETLTIEVPLDPIHRRADLALREDGVSVDELIKQAVTQAAEQQIYAAVQATKYEIEN